MLNVRQILEAKPHQEIYSVTPSQLVYEALELMAARNIGAVLVMENGNLAGIFSERDYARKGILKDRAAKSTPVSEVMTAKVFTVTPETDIDECLQMVSEKKIRHLPVVENGRITGLISIGDVVTAMIREQQFRIESLEQYIAS